MHSRSCMDTSGLGWGHVRWDTPSATVPSFMASTARQGAACCRGQSMARSHWPLTCNSAGRCTWWNPTHRSWTQFCPFRKRALQLCCAAPVPFQRLRTGCLGLVRPCDGATLLVTADDASGVAVSSEILFDLHTGLNGLGPWRMCSSFNAAVAGRPAVSLQSGLVTCVAFAQVCVVQLPRLEGFALQQGRGGTQARDKPPLPLLRITSSQSGGPPSGLGHSQPDAAPCSIDMIGAGA